jgi:hypothetical protein
MRTRATTAAKKQRNESTKHFGTVKVKKECVQQHATTLEPKNMSAMKHKDTIRESYVSQTNKDIVIKEEEFMDEKLLFLGTSTVKKGKKKKKKRELLPRLVNLTLFCM